MVLEKRTRVRWHPSRYGRRPPKAGDRSRNPCASASRYDRRIDLPRVLPLWPHELDDESPEGRRSILGKIRRALWAERRRGVAGHWTYDLARHVELLRVYRLELEAVGVSGRRMTPSLPGQHVPIEECQPRRAALRPARHASSQPERE